MNQSMSLTTKEILEWHIDIGVDECIDDTPANKLNSVPTSMADVLEASKKQQTKPIAHTDKIAQAYQSPAAPKQEDGFIPLGTAEAAQDALRAAAACETLQDLEKAIRAFEGCPLKRTAKSTVFQDGDPSARIMVIGECPGVDEDNTGTPFSGQAGLLLDKMFAAIGYDRASEDSAKALYLTNLVYWRPPGNRVPTDSEIEICRPFALRHIEIINPEVLVIMGGVTAKSILKTGHGITRLRGKWTEFKTDAIDKPVKTLPMLHPEFLLKSPDRKKYAWQDLQLLRDSL